MYLLFALAILIASSNIAFAQVSTLQQPQPSSSQNQSPVNMINNLFNNPAAANAASSEANPYGNTPYSYTGGLPRFSGDFWGNLFHRHVVEAGTVLTGTLQDDLSSKTSKTGDVFSILLADGYKSNNEQLIPENARIIGTVVSATPAVTTGNGVAGSLQISLQTLSLPDGRSMPISAAIQYNPNQSAKTDITKKNYLPIGQYLQSAEYAVISSGGALARQMGLAMPIKTQTGGGPDFVLNKGELLPVKLSQPLDVSSLISPPASTTPGNPPTAPNPQPGSTTLPAPAPNPLPRLTFPMPDSNANTLPGNSAPAGPEPF